MLSGLKIQKKTKITAGILVLLMLFVILFSSFYIVTEAEHECEGEDCPVCACIEQCETTLHQLAGCGAAVLAVAIAIVFIVRIVPAIRFFFRTGTPVSMKVRLNN